MSPNNQPSTVARVTESRPASDSNSGEEIQNTPGEILGNFFKVVAFQITLRTGWIFKTESIVMPVVLDLVGGSGWLRGILPVLNRFGQSIPPMLAADFVSRTPLKKRVLCMAALTMSFCFLALAAIWKFTGGERVWWLPIVFLFIYGIFFIAVGILQLVLSTLIGKVIRTERRGRLMLIANIGGASCAAVCAYFLLSEWISPEQGRFENIFAVAGFAFLVAGLIGLLLRETRDDFPRAAPFSVREVFAKVYLTLQGDRNFRVLAVIGALFGLSMSLLPHYQRLGFDRVKVDLDVLIPWLIAQNVGVACFSLPSGWLADRFGNRTVLRLVLLGLCATPILALWLSWQGETAKGFYIWVFVLLGLTPVTFRTFNNYTLELVGRDEQPRYLSTLSLCIAIPTMILAAPLGWSIDRFGFEPVFLLVTVSLAAAWSLTSFLLEPRHQK